MFVYLCVCIKGECVDVVERAKLTVFNWLAPTITLVSWKENVSTDERILFQDFNIEIYKYKYVQVNEYRR